MDLLKIESAIRMLLEGIDEDVSREGLVETPKRVARMYEELVAGMTRTGKEYLNKTFAMKEGEVVLVKDIEFYSLCEHHILPFFGKVHIAYIPNEKVVGLSKLGRVVEVYARRLQIQERMTNEIANIIMEELEPKGILVVIEAEHLCMEMRGIKKRGSKTVCISSKGVLQQDENMRNKIIDMINLS